MACLPSSSCPWNNSLGHPMHLVGKRCRLLNRSSMNIMIRLTTLGHSGHTSANYTSHWIVHTPPGFSAGCFLDHFFMSPLIESGHMKKDIITEAPLSAEIIKEKIYIIRGKKVMLDRDLAALYQVPTMVLNQAVKRHMDRFPEDFMFHLTKSEMGNWISQNVISNSTLKQSLRKPPLAFTEQGIAMLSSVLNSKMAIQMNIQIVRIFTKLREMVDAHRELREKVEEMERENVTNFREIFRIIRLLIKEDEKPKGNFGFTTD
jgi:hypothetical protein